MDFEMRPQPSGNASRGLGNSGSGVSGGSVAPPSFAKLGSAAAYSQSSFPSQSASSETTPKVTVTASGGSALATASWNASAISVATEPYDTNPVLPAVEFEGAWNRSQIVDVWGLTLKRVPISDAVVPHMKRLRLHCVASGTVQQVEKLYFFARSGPSLLAMLELSVDLATKRLSVVFKSTSVSGSPDRANDQRLFGAFQSVVSDVFG